MKAKKILFVGGPSDGYRKDDPRTNGHYCGTIRTLDCDPCNMLAYPGGVGFDLTAQTAGVKTNTYHIKRFRDENGKEYEVAFDSSITNPMEALIKGYRYHKNKRPKRFSTMARIKKYFIDYPLYTIK